MGDLTRAGVTPLVSSGQTLAGLTFGVHGVASPQDCLYSVRHLSNLLDTTRPVSSSPLASLRFDLLMSGV